MSGPEERTASERARMGSLIESCGVASVCKDRPEWMGIASAMAAVLAQCLGYEGERAKQGYG